jgi:hypothetical protein
LRKARGRPAADDGGANGVSSRRLVPTAANRFSLGYIGGRDALVNQDAIGFTEELLTAVLAGHAVATVGSTTTLACGAAEAKLALDEAVARANPDAAKFVAYFAATLNSTACRTLEGAEAGLGSSTARRTPRSASWPAALRRRSSRSRC